MVPSEHEWSNAAYVVYVYKQVLNIKPTTLCVENTELN